MHNRIPAQVCCRLSFFPDTVCIFIDPDMAAHPDRFGQDGGGYGVGAERLRRRGEMCIRDSGHFVADRVFIFTDQQAQACGLSASVVDSGMYACIYLDHYDDEIACAGKLLAFCRNNGYRIAGDYLCEVLTEFNVFDGDQRSMFLRLQVPVEFSRTP